MNKSNLIEKAIEFATWAHKGQKRKGNKEPYIVHPLAVGEILEAMTDDEEIICAGYLHDTIEDNKEVTKEMLEEEFTSRIAWIVDCESEDKSKTWMERKQNTIEELLTASDEVQLVALADKLANMRDIEMNYKVMGEEFWNRFNMKDKKKIGDYYRGVANSLYDNFKEDKYYMEYCHLVTKIFGDEAKTNEVRF